MKTNLQKLKLVAAGIMAFGLVACGPSKEDVCGGCPTDDAILGDIKSQCEAGYDICDGDGDCVDALEAGYTDLLCK